MELLNFTKEQWIMIGTAIIYVIQAGIAIFSIIVSNKNNRKTEKLNKELLELNRRMIEVETKPMLYASLVVNNQKCFLRLKNIGKSVAYNIFIDIDNPLYQTKLEEELYGKVSDEDYYSSRLIITDVFQDIDFMDARKSHPQLLPDEEANTSPLNLIPLVKVEKDFKIQLNINYVNSYGEEICSKSLVSISPNYNQKLKELIGNHDPDVLQQRYDNMKDVANAMPF